MRNNQLITVLLIVAVMLSPIALLARTTTYHPSANATAAPIGSVESLETVQINGTPSGQQSLVWNGDEVRAALGATAQVMLSDIGKVTLRGGSAAKLMTNIESQSLRAELLSGELNVVLKPESSATVQIAGATFVTTKGAQLRAGMRAGQPFVRATNGSVVSLGRFGLLSGVDAVAAQQQQAGPRKYIIKPLNLGTNTEIRARSTRNIQVQVTDENDRPVPDAPVLFLLGAGGSGSSNAGTLAGQATARSLTNSQGIANVNFTASENIGSSTRIEIRVENSEAVWQGSLNVIRAVAGFWAPQNAVPIFSVIGAGVALGAYRYATREGIPPEQRIDPRQGTTVIVP